VRTNLIVAAIFLAAVKSVPADYYNVWVTTYTVAVSKHDKPFLQKRRFQYMVLGTSSYLLSLLSLLVL
jgi:hypothetical protein